MLHQAHVLWPWFVGMLPAAGVVFALDGVLIGAGDVGFLRTITIVAAVGAFAPLNLAALHWHWGLGGVWAGLTAFIVRPPGRHALADPRRALGGHRHRVTSWRSMADRRSPTGWWSSTSRRA